MESPSHRLGARVCGSGRMNGGAGLGAGRKGGLGFDGEQNFECLLIFGISEFSRVVIIDLSSSPNLIETDLLLSSSSSISLKSFDVSRKKTTTDFHDCLLLTHTRKTRNFVRRKFCSQIVQRLLLRSMRSDR